MVNNKPSEDADQGLVTGHLFLGAVSIVYPDTADSQLCGKHRAKRHRFGRTPTLELERISRARARIGDGLDVRRPSGERAADRTAR